jgi:hypothetical protein
MQPGASTLQLQAFGMQHRLESQKRASTLHSNTRSMLFFLFNHEEEAALASVFSLTWLAYQLSDQFLIITGAWGAGATSLLIGKKNDSLYFSYVGVENGMMQSSL